MKIISATKIVLFLSSSVLTSSLAFPALSTTDINIKQQEAHPDNVEQFLDLMNKKSTILASSDSRLRNTQEICAPVEVFEYSSLSEEVKKEIEEVFNPFLFDFESVLGDIADDDIDLIPLLEKPAESSTMSLDFSKMPSFMKLYEEKCSAANGDVYTMSLECLDSLFAWKDFPMCFKDCPNGLTDNIEAATEEAIMKDVDFECEVTFAKKDTSAKSAASVVGGLKVAAGAGGAFLTMLVL